MNSRKQAPPRAMGTWLLGLLLSSGLVADEPSPPLPSPAAQPVDFARDIKPLLEASCIKCHAHGQKKGGYAIDTRELLLQGGDSGAAVKTTDSASSLVVHLVAGLDPERLMPAKGAHWTPAQVGLLRAWIDQGAVWPAGLALGRGAQAPLEPRQVQLPAARGNLTNPVDRLLKPYLADHGIKPPKPVTDRVFARRVYLDTIGLLPTPQELSVFEQDRRADKRVLLVRQLLGDNPRYAAHWLTFWNDCLRNDYRGTGYIDGGRKQITPWLYSALATNLAYDRFVARLVAPDEGSEGFTKGIVWRGAINASQTPHMQAAQNISQVFLGINLKCASCHDSFISNWKLADAYGLAGIYTDEPLELVRCDKPTGQMAQRQFLFPQLGAVADSTNKTARLQSLARLLTCEQNGRLGRTVVNRLWAKFMGRGLVEPVDEMDDPPWHPDLLDWLAVDLAANGHDLRHTMELILTSQAYQWPATGGEELATDKYIFRGPVVKRLSAEQFLDALSLLTGLWQPLPANTQIDFTAGRPAALRIVPQAQWIWSCPDASKGAPPATVFFRKSVRLPEVPSEALVVAAADNRFTLFVNGHEVGAGDDWHKPQIIDVRDHLVAGTNVFAVKATNDAPKDEPTPNPAGLMFEFLVRSEPVTKPSLALDVRLGSNESWLCSTNHSEGWEQPAFAAEAWRPAHDIGPASQPPWDLAQRWVATVSSAAQHNRVRAGFVAADPLASALGRPNREQVATTRPTVATTMQALELTNGATLAEMLSRGAEHLLSSDPHPAPRQFANHLYAQAFGRRPTPSELKAAEAVLGKPVRREGVADLLWAMAMQPEFQLIY